jgi:hypothetical protein
MSKEKKKNKFVSYYHHATDVTVREDLLGKHKEYCLCYSCKHFRPEYEKLNCRIAQLLYSVNVTFNLVTPVWECPDFKEKQ